MPKQPAKPKASNKPSAQSAVAQRYKFALNPYPDSRVSTCPTCGKATGQRKLPLMIHIEPRNLIALNYTCRYCAKCNLLIGHQHEIEAYLTAMFSQRDPSVIGNEYLVMGVIPRAAWQANMVNPRPPAEILDQLAKFRSYTILQRTMAGWFPQGVQPPLEPAPPAQDWVKRGTG